MTVSLAATDNTAPFTVSQTTTVRYYSSDVAANLETAKSQQVRVDAAAPTASITSPAAGSSFTRGHQGDGHRHRHGPGHRLRAPSGLTSVAFFLDGTKSLGTDATSPYPLTWNTSNVALGTHRLTVIATDASGNSVTSATVTVTIR